MTAAAVPAVAGASEGYEPALFDTLDVVEDRHFWFAARRRVVGTVLRQLTAKLSPGYHVLELGCGNGGMLRLMRECSPGGSVTGMDLYEEGLRHARRRCAETDVSLVRGDVRQAPFREAFAVVGMFDVLEHITDDVGVLADVRRMLAPGGAILLTVPAHMTLWSYFDVAAHHARRYSPAELSEKLGRAGFVVEYVTQFMRAIYPLVWLGRRVKQAMGRREDAVAMTQRELRITPGLNGLLSAALAGEAGLVRRRRRMSPGTSLLAVGRRRD
jgi:ubiquinone/menaquinone biosynthesis C-methylase UbiE